MPYGRYGVITYVTMKCPICTKEYTRAKSILRKTCSRACGNTLRNNNKRHKSSLWKVNKYIERILLDMRLAKQEKELHLRIIIDVDNYGDSWFI